MGKKVFITGASSGIGEYVAYAFAKRKANLGLVARRAIHLNKVAEKCRKLGGMATVYVLDVSNADMCKKATQEFLQEYGGIDIVFANAGISGIDGLGSGESATINRILKTNILGVTNTTIPFLPTMRDQGSGHVVVVSSVAGFRGLAGRGGYSGSKAAIRTMANGWRYSLERAGINITTICPGFVKTPLVKRNTFPMFFIIDPEAAAEKILYAIRRKVKTYIFPWPYKLFIPLLKIIPSWLIRLATPRRSEF
jgi:short-subunit dehydrogenase